MVKRKVFQIITCAMIIIKLFISSLLFPSFPADRSLRLWGLGSLPWIYIVKHTQELAHPVIRREILQTFQCHLPTRKPDISHPIVC